jgi:hypothetical protein
MQTLSVENYTTSQQASMSKPLSSVQKEVTNRLSSLNIQSSSKSNKLGWFCAKCTKLLALPLTKDPKIDDQASTGWVLHYSNIKTLTAVANQGCQLCFVVLQSNIGYQDKDRIPDTAIWLQREYLLERVFEDDEDDQECLSDDSSIAHDDEKNDDTETPDVDEDYNSYSDLTNQCIGIKWVVKKVNGARSMHMESIVASAVPLPAYPTGLQACESTADIPLESWFSTCLNDHSCEKDRTTGYLPKRLLECTSHGLRLLDSNSIDKNARYAALSYSWGPSPAHLTLTTENMPNLQKGIPDEDLPLTFSDAAKIAVRLDIKYIWIDSLCIIQSGDNGEDWRDQVGEMHNIYGSCILQIAAAHSSDAFGGCFSKRPKGGQRPTILPPAKFANIDVPKNGDKPALLLPSVDEFHLDSRGWVYQERLLAPRTVHFDKWDVFWECHKVKCSASYLLGEQTLHDDIRKSVVYESNGPKYGWRWIIEDGKVDPYHWGEMITEYSKRSLTRPQDRLVAFSSVAQRIAEHSQDDYIAGYLASILPQALLWTCMGGVRCGTEQLKFQPNMCINDYGVPTWSWGSVNNEIFSTMLNSGVKASLVSTDVKLVDESHKYGPMRNASIRLRGPVFQLDIKGFKGTDLPSNRILFQGSVLIIDDLYQNGGCLRTRQPNSIAYYASVDNGIWPEEDEDAEDNPNPHFTFTPNVSADYAHVDIWKNVVCLVIEADDDEDDDDEDDESKFTEMEIRGLVLVPWTSDKEKDKDVKYVRIGEFDMTAVSEKGTSPLNRMETMEVTVV